MEHDGILPLWLLGIVIVYVRILTINDNDQENEMGTQTTSEDKNQETQEDIDKIKEQLLLSNYV